MSTLTTDLRQGLHSGIAYKAPVRVATTGPITLSGLQTIDDVALAAGDRVLVKNQADGTTNGVYIADTSSWDRAPDFDGTFDVRRGTQLRVNEGTVGRDVWYLSTADPITIGTTSLAFSPEDVDVVATTPSFQARRTADQTSGNVILFNVEVHDQGGVYNPATGVFTASIAGPYIITALVNYLNSSGGAADAVTHLRQNTSTILTFAADTVANGKSLSQSVSTVVLLAANDEIDVWSALNLAANLSATGNFSAHLLP